MAENSKIEWTHHTMNFWVGCTRISPACDNCYAASWAKRTGQAHLWDGQRRRTATANWRKLAKWDVAAAAAGERHRVFSNSLADFFDNQVWDRWRNDAWHFIARAPNLDFLLLTKRPQNIAKMLPSPEIGAPAWGEGWSNVWLGTTVEDRKRLANIDHLRAVPAAVRFLSIEPLLEDLGEIDLTGIHLVIVGGESGPGARPMHPAWVRSIREQCAAQRSAFFFKQWGDWLPGQNAPHPYTREPEILGGGPRSVAHWQDGGWGSREAPEPASRNYVMWSPDGVAHPGGSRGRDGYFEVAAWAARVGKKAAGRLLDGRIHDAMPEVRS